MQILTQLTFHDTEEYQKFCAVMANADLAGVKTVKQDHARPESPKANPVAQPPAKPAAVKTPAAKTPPPAPEEEEVVDEGELTYAVVKEAVLNVSTTKGKAAARRALAAVGATAVGPHIAETDYPALMEACKKELA